MDRVRDSSLTSFYTSLRYEDGPWSLLRVDKGLRYGLKSLFHRPQPTTREDAAYFRRTHRHLRGGTWRNRPAQARTIHFASVGDLMWLPGGWSSALSPSLRRRLHDVELRFANLETPVDDERPVPKLTYARFNAPPVYLEPWLSRGTSVLSLCNNHALDQGLEGLVRTRARIEASPHGKALGGAHDGDAQLTFEHEGVKIAILGSTFGINPWGHGVQPSDYPAGIPIHAFGNPARVTDWETVSTNIAQARAAADLVFYMPHWGFEFEYFPDAALRRDAHRLVALGVDIVLGSSPHVVQPLEIVSVNGYDPQCPTQVTRTGPAGPAVVAYSHGNCISSMPSVACNTGLLLECALSLSPTGAMQLDELTWSPVVSRNRWRRPRASLGTSNDYDVTRHLRHFYSILGPS